MTTPKPPPIAPAFAGKANAVASVIREVADVLRTCAVCAKEIEAQRTERSRIEHSTRVQLELIQSRRELLVRFMDETFAERQQNFRELFDRLDLALERDSLDGTRDVLGAIVHLAKSSPFEALRDAASAQEALQDKGVTWDF